MKKKGDILLIACIVGTAGIIWLFRSLFLPREPGMVLVKQNGTIIGRYLLEEEQKITVQDEKGGYNVIVISEGEVKVTDSDCPDKLCVLHKPAEYRGESIICLPHRLIVEIEKGEEGDLDGVTY